jgi:hypothetical protein
MRLISTVIIFFLIFIFSVNLAYAVNDPLAAPNNKFGIHIFSEKDLEDAGKLINSGGGDWGYVTIVITEKERDRDRWQQVFDKMRRLHLIPIVRLATKADEGTWEKPKTEEINNWIAFLNSLNWVTQNRYIVVSNEPNHAYEWGGEIKPDEYASYLKEFSTKLKEASPDFFILPAGLDASADGKNGTMEISRYMQGMLKKEPELFNFIDGWNSHSYPNPNFSGTATVTGKATIAGYKWELGNLKGLGLIKELPVFITETGWSREKLTDEDIAERYLYAFQNVWSDSQVAAVTPFILNYPQDPFGKFSWKDSNGNFYPFTEKVIGLPKEQGKPVQITKGEVLAAFAQPVMLTGSDFVGAILARNTGQSIWTQNSIGIGSDSENFQMRTYSLNEIEPMRLGLVVFKAAAPENPGIYSTSLFLKSEEGEKITDSFKIEGVSTKIDQSQVTNFFGGIGNYLQRIF